MKDRWENFGYRLCLRSMLWSRIWYFWYCPYPVVVGNNSARSCVVGGYCGCSNGRRFRSARTTATPPGEVL